jgi:hypothetical protein
MNAELGMMNAECRDATLGFAPIQHSAFHIQN